MVFIVPRRTNYFFFFHCTFAISYFTGFVLTGGILLGTEYVGRRQNTLQIKIIRETNDFWPALLNFSTYQIYEQYISLAAMIHRKCHRANFQTTLNGSSLVRRSSSLNPLVARQNLCGHRHALYQSPKTKQSTMVSPHTPPSL